MNIQDSQKPLLNLVLFLVLFQRLPRQIEERNEKLKKEMLGK